MTGVSLRWIRLSLALLMLTVPVSGAWAGDAYKPTPAAASPAKPSNSSDAEATPDDSTMDGTDEPAEGTAPAPPKKTPPRPAGRNAARTPTDSVGGDDAQRPAAQAADPARAERLEWEEKARKADERVAAAQARLDEAQRAYTNMRMRGYPSGDARVAILKDIEDAKAELAAAQAERASLEDKAREAGVPPSWIMP